MIEDILKKITQLQEQAKNEFFSLKTIQEIERFKGDYLGRKGKVNRIFEDIAALEEEVRKKAGNVANALKKELEELIFSKLNVSPEGDYHTIDETIPGISPHFGTLHPITQFFERIVPIFESMGFEVVEDREVETQEVNFDLLNFPRNHPARDMQDTFYVKMEDSNALEEPELVLRTHTSSVQIRAMKTRKPPVRIIVPGRVFRHEATDASHETTFYQLEGLVIDKDISVAHMKYVLEVVLQRLFGENVRIKLRPSFFPFVEPGHEVDMSCIICEQKGCSVCKNTGWVEMLGAGMVHPNVLKNMNVDHNLFNGFAFGMGIDRLMMLYYGVDDVRLSYSGDLRFLNQF